MTPEQVTEIEERANAATEGPWVEVPNTYRSPGISDVKRLSCASLPGALAHDTWDHDAAFIAAARQDVPDLCNALREAWKRIETLEGALADWGATCVDGARFPSQATMELTVECTGKLAEGGINAT